MRNWLRVSRNSLNIYSINFVTFNSWFFGYFFFKFRYIEEVLNLLKDLEYDNSWWDSININKKIFYVLNLWHCFFWLIFCSIFLHNLYKKNMLIDFFLLLFSLFIFLFKYINYYKARFFFFFLNYAWSFGLYYTTRDMLTAQK